MQLFVKTIEGKTLTLEVDECSTCDHVKSLVEERTAVPAQEQRLLFGGKQLEGGSLSDYDVAKESTVHLLGRLEGGFGAGNIPSYSFLEGKAYRHGDIEDVLSDMLKKSSGMFGGLSRGSKFGGLDIKRVYFGNWLRDYSQAMDCASLTKMPKQTVLNLVMGLGFLAHGYATGEFEVTDERLGVYSCVEHIDNPKGYAADQPGGDARHLDPRLRGPVDPRELEIDLRTGMKNYIANEQGTWDTSSRLVRERIQQCIMFGRRGRATGNEKDIYECYRLLGTLLHTLEDFTAHSNWCELSLRRMGHQQVFCHTGDAASIQTPAGPAPPLVTGSFGGADFIHSMLGEASDKLSEASVSDLAKAMDTAKARSTERSMTDDIGQMLFQIPGGGGQDLSREMQNVEGIRSRAQQGDASTMSPQELHATLWQVLTFRDNVAKSISSTIEKIPGLSSLVEKLTDSINRFVMTTLEPLLKPVMGQATTALQQGSAQVLNNEDQYEVFNNPHSTDPTHSFLSKDHFALILNEPAGAVAVVIVKHTVSSIVNAWEHDNVDPNQVAHEILQALHHPYFYDNNSKIQREMGTCMKQWFDSLKHDEQQFNLRGLTKDSVRNHKNKRRGHESDQVGHGHGGQYNSFLSPEKVSGFASEHIPGASGVINTFNQVSGVFNSAGGGGGGRREMDTGASITPSGGPPPAMGGGGFAPQQGGYNAGYQSGPPQHQQGGFHPGPSYDTPPPQQHHFGGGYDNQAPAGFAPPHQQDFGGGFAGQPQQGGGWQGQHQQGSGGGYPGQQHHNQHQGGGYNAGYGGGGY